MATLILSTEAALAVLQSKVDRMEQVMESVAASLAIITRVQLQNEATMIVVSELRAEVSKIRDEMPVLKLVVKAAMAGASIVIVSVFYMMLKIAGVPTK